MNDAVWIVLGLTGLAVVVALIGASIQERRGRQLRAAAEEMGFSYQLEDPALAVELFGTGDKMTRVQNVLRGQAQGLEVIFLDLLQVIRRVQHVRPVRFSLLVFRDEEANWPTFSMRPREFLSRLGGTSGTGTSLFEDDREFGRRYRLEALRTGIEATNAEQVAEVFTEDVRRYFAKHPGWWLEARQQRLILSHGRLLPAAGLQGFLQNGFEVMNVLRGEEEPP